jgi:hypothetical protein
MRLLSEICYIFVFVFVGLIAESVPAFGGSVRLGGYAYRYAVTQPFVKGQWDAVDKETISIKRGPLYAKAREFNSGSLRNSQNEVLRKYEQ